MYSAVFFLLQGIMTLKCCVLNVPYIFNGTLQISSIRDIANVFELFSYAWTENCLIQTDQETDNIN